MFYLTPTFMWSSGNSILFLLREIGTEKIDQKNPNGKSPSDLPFIFGLHLSTRGGKEILLNVRLLSTIFCNYYSGGYRMEISPDHNWVGVNLLVKNSVCDVINNRFYTTCCHHNNFILDSFFIFKWKSNTDLIEFNSCNTLALNESTCRFEIAKNMCYSRNS